MYTDYFPVLKGHAALEDAKYRLARGERIDPLPKILAAAQADGFWPEPWGMLAEIRLNRWQVTGDAEDWDRFVETADTYCSLDPRHHVTWFTRGTWFLTAWKKSQRPKDIDQALDAFRKAVERYPNRATYHAQLAWTLHLASDAEAARKEAQLAYDLDQKMPHQEFKLSQQHVVDPEPSKKPATIYREESAEQTVLRLRTPSAEAQSK